ncbi:5210_t:CDS:2, partial [Cetraspora pellucida]
KHIGITQVEVQVYVNECFICAINSSIKEKTDMKSVISVASWQHIQIDLIDFYNFTNAGTVAAHLVKDVFRILGSPKILQNDNGREFKKIVKQ